MVSPGDTVERVHAAQHRLLVRVQDLTDEIAGRPSLLPGWRVAHVLAHVARNADSVVRRLEGAAQDRIVDQYPGGSEGRAAEIEAGARLSAAELVADVRASGLAVEQAATALPEAAWGRLTRSVDGELITAAEVMTSRFREVEVHHVDLGLGYHPSDWPAEFVTQELAAELPKLPGRADPAQLLVWLTGRGAAPALTPWR
jgi:maleylpyruvate isomerase